MKKLLIISTVLFSSLFVNAQKWDSVGGGVTGYCYDRYLYYPNNPYFYGQVCSLLADDSLLYIGGFFDTVDHKDFHATNYGISFAQWNDTALSFSNTLPYYLLSNLHPVINTITKYNNDICFGGWFGGYASIKALNCFEWNGNSWDSLSSGIRNEVNAMIEYKGKLYAGIQGAPQGYELLEWDGAHWKSEPHFNGRFKSFLAIYALTIYNNMLIVGGLFDTVAGVPANNIAAFDGNNWFPLGKGMRSHLPLTHVYSLGVNNGKLYAGGLFDSADGKLMNNISVWDGNTWAPLGSGVHREVLAISGYNGNLYVGGTFDSAGGKPVKSIACWNDTTWNSVGLGVSKYKSRAEVMSMAVYKGSLYVGGMFDSAGGIPCNNLARWTAPWATDLIIHGNETILFPNPNNGKFTIQSSVLSGQSSIVIYNILGQEIYTSQFSPANYTLTIDVGQQPSGVYLYSLMTNNGEQFTNGKFVIE